MGGQLRQTLPREIFAADVLTVARTLLGCVVEHRSPEGPVAIRLTEVEAYAGQQDPGSHAFRGQTPRTSVMFGDPGHAYVYFSYGMHWCLNLVCGPAGSASAVLLRAGEVVQGLDIARSRRLACRRDVDLARGPARLTQALGVGRGQKSTDVCSGGPLRVVAGAPVPDTAVTWGPRVGVSGAGAVTPWRAVLNGEPTVSAYRPSVPGTARRRTSGRLAP